MRCLILKSTRTRDAIIDYRSKGANSTCFDLLKYIHIVLQLILCFSFHYSLPPFFYYYLFIPISFSITSSHTIAFGYKQL